MALVERVRREVSAKLPRLRHRQAKPVLSVVIPLFNEEDSLPELHAQLSLALQRLGREYELLFVDDGSTDRSFERLAKLRAQDPRLKAVQFRRNYGKSAALDEGFRRAQGDIIVTLDADLQDDPAEIPKLLEKLGEGYDLVSGWKQKRQDRWTKRLASRVFNRVTAALSGIPIHDFNCGLKAYRREVIEAIRVYGQLHRFLPALAGWQGFRVGEVPVRHRPRKYGKTKFGVSRYAAGLFDLITVMFLNKFNKRPLHLFGILGLLFFLAGATITGYLAYQRLVHLAYLTNRPVLFLGILLIIVGGQFISIGLLGEMITESQKERVRYSIRRVIE